MGFGVFAAEEPDWQQVTFANVCHGPVNLYWLKFGDDINEEIFLSTIPVGHEFKDSTDIGATYRLKWADGSNGGKFGEDILEEWVIQSVASGPEQLIKVCIEARMREDLWLDSECNVTVIIQCQS